MSTEDTKWRIEVMGGSPVQYGRIYEAVAGRGVLVPPGNKDTDVLIVFESNSRVSLIELIDGQGIHWVPPDGSSEEEKLSWLERTLTDIVE